MPGEAVSRARAVDEEVVSVKREVVLPRDWWAAGLEGARGLWELFGRRPASLDGAVCTRLALYSPLGVRAAVLGDPPMAGGLTAGLAHPRVQPEIGHQPSRVAKR